MTLNIPQYDYLLPPRLVASSPSVPRDTCRLLHLNRQTGLIGHRRFLNLSSLLPPCSVLVFNQTKVFPARLIVAKATGGKVEILFIHPQASGRWLALASPRPRIDTILYVGQKPAFKVIKSDSKTGHLELEPLISSSLYQFLARHGQTPLPPYIRSRSPESLLRRQYQSIFAKNVGSAAAPTASLHFTPRVLKSLADRGVQTAYITLHVGLGTFASMTQENINSGTLHTEPYSIKPKTTTQLNRLKSQGWQIIAVGTTTARCLESASDSEGRLNRSSSDTDLFIRPGYKFKFIDGLITNFHLPQSSLLMLVSAFVSYPNTPHPFADFNSSSIGLAYQQAISKKYRFFSFGDAMLII